MNRNTERLIEMTQKKKLLHIYKSELNEIEQQIIMRCFIDGNALCITRHDFINLQEDDAVFISLTKKQIRELKRMNTEGVKN